MFRMHELCGYDQYTQYTHTSVGNTPEISEKSTWINNPLFTYTPYTVVC